MAPRGKGVATILAIGTANPPNVILQPDYPDLYFKEVNNDDEHLQRLKLKFKSICENSKIEERHVALTEEFLKQNTEDGKYESLPLENLPTKEVVNLAKEASLKAIQEWGQSISEITHLILCTTSCFGVVPGPDTHLARLLNLKPTVNRLMIFGHGCHAGGTILRIAKDMAENNVGSRVLAVCSETMLASFQRPTDDFAPATDVLIGHALFADGAAAMIIAADPNPSVERPLFEIVSASQTTIPDTQNSIRAQIPVENGRLVYHFVKEIPNIVSNNVKKCVIDALCSIGFDEDIDWNKLFYVVHPGGPLVLSKVEEKLGLSEGKLKESWNVLRQYGNMWSSTVIFILNEMRKRSKIEGKGTTGEGLEWGVFLGFGPGVVTETVLLRSVAYVEK